MPINNRTRVGNGSALPSGIDGRRSAARRWKEIFRDGMDRTGGKHETLCRQLASLVVARERLDAALASGEAIDVLALVRIAGAISRTMSTLGIVADDGPGEDVTAEVIARIRDVSRTEAA